MYRGDNPRINSVGFKKEVSALIEEELADKLKTIEQDVHDQVTKLLPKLLPALLGLRKNSFGEDYEIVRVNGIDHSHPLGVEYRQAAHQAAERLVTKALKDWEPSKKMIASVRKEYAEALEYACRDAAQAEAGRTAQTWAETFVNDVLDGKFDDPGAPPSERNRVLRDIAEGKLKGAKAVKAAAEALGEEAS